MIGTRPRNVVATVINLGRLRLAAVHNRFVQIGQGPGAALLPGLLIGKIQVQEHEHSGFRIHTEKRDQADLDRDAHVVSQQVKEPERPDRGKRYRQHDNQGLGD